MNLKTAMQATEVTENTEMKRDTRIFPIAEGVRTIFTVGDEGFASVSSVLSVAKETPIKSVRPELVEGQIV